MSVTRDEMCLFVETAAIEPERLRVRVQRRERCMARADDQVVGVAVHQVSPVR